MINPKTFNKKEADMDNKFSILNKGDVSIMSKFNYIKKGTKYIIGAGAMIACLSSAAFGLDKDGEYYLIKNANDLKSFAGIVNGGENGAKGKIMNDIKLNGGNVVENGKLKGRIFEEWTPIGAEDNPFGGELISGDGETKQIVGLYIDKENSSYQGFFGFIEEGGKVKNIEIDGYIRGEFCIGGIAGYSRGNISDCITGVNSIIEGQYNVGGNVGSNEGTIEGKCKNSGTVIGHKDNVGGNVGNNSNMIKGTYENVGNIEGTEKVGGNVGLNGGLNGGGGIEGNCSNSGNVKGQKWVGGNVGLTGWGGMIEGKCINVGNIKGVEKVGGNVGCNDMIIKGEYINEGKIDGEEQVGGNIGHNSGELTDYNGVKYCYVNKEKVDGTTDVGGNIGFNDGKIRSTFKNDGDVSGDNYAGRNIGRTTKGVGEVFGGKGKVNEEQTMWPIGNNG